MDDVISDARHAELSSEVRELLDWHARNAPPLETDIADLRAWQDAVGARYDIAPGRVGSVQDVEVDGTHRPAALRVYRPENETSQSAIFFAHGGSWMLGSVESHDNLCRRICHATGLTVLSAEYGLAPENPFPHQTEDCLRIYQWVRTHATDLSIDPDGLIVCGDSSGANLVAVLCHELRARGAPMPLAQILIYPSVALSKHRSYASWQTYGKGFLIGENSLARTMKLYLPNAADIEDPRASPLLYPHFTGQPPALVITADHDPIRDGGREYAGRLIAAGVDTRFVEYPGTIHGFLSFGIPSHAVERALLEIEEFVVDVGAFAPR